MGCTKISEKIEKYLLTSYPDVNKRLNSIVNEAKLKFTTDDIVGCHNDLAVGNIIYDKKNNSVNFIDFEYYGYNSFLYDIANYFEELCTFDCDWTLYPNFAERKIFYESYFGHECESKLQNVIDDKIMILSKLNNLMWGFSSLIKYDMYNSEIELKHFHNKMERFYQI